MNNIAVVKIYFDMDGVLADFEQGVRDLCGMEPPSQNVEQQTPDEDNAMWEAIKKTPHFYDRLELMPGAKEMFDAVYAKYGDKCEILTGVPKPKRGIKDAGEDKTRWVHRLLSKDIKVNIVLRAEKPRYCTGKGCILIDDMDQNIRNWEDIGGTGIKNNSAAETMQRLREYGIL